MRKSTQVVIVVVFVWVIGSHNVSSSAQKSVSAGEGEQVAATCVAEKFVMPSSVAVDNRAFSDYLKVASLPVDDRRTAFRGLSSEQKAAFFKVQFALQLVKRRDITKQQTDFLLDAISKTSADLYETNDPAKVRLSNEMGQDLEIRAFSVFAPRDASNILGALLVEKAEDIELLQKYEDLLRFGTRERRRVVRQMPISERVNIWKTQLAFHLATGKFSRSQNEFILEMMTSLSEASFGPRNLSKEEEAAAFGTLISKVLSHFSRAEAFAVFEELGIQKKVADSESSQQPTWCDCRWYCGDGRTCRTVNCVIFPECGPFGDWECQYKCTF